MGWRKRKDLRSQILHHFQACRVEELVEIWTTNDRTELSEQAFEVIGEILSERLGELPPQNEPVFDYAKTPQGKERLFELRGQLLRHFREYQTEELANIWTTNDRTERSELAFEVIGEILSERLDSLPPQNQPVTDIPEEEPDEKLFIVVEAGSERFLDPDLAPVFYRPKEVLWMNYWLNRAAKAAVVITILISLPEFMSLKTIIFSFFSNSVNPNWEPIAWLIAIIPGVLGIALNCFIVYFSLKALASLLIILMEMEYNSRESG